ncbi:hypothetical protein H5T88_05175 [bacterium]|nr:hypothetical protein [bacterium]
MKNLLLTLITIFSRLIGVFFWTALFWEIGRAIVSQFSSSSYLKLVGGATVAVPFALSCALVEFVIANMKWGIMPRISLSKLLVIITNLLVFTFWNILLLMAIWVVYTTKLPVPLQLLVVLPIIVGFILCSVYVRKIVSLHMDNANKYPPEEYSKLREKCSKQAFRVFNLPFLILESCAIAAIVFYLYMTRILPSIWWVIFIIAVNSYTMSLLAVSRYVKTLETLLKKKSCHEEEKPPRKR